MNSVNYYQILNLDEMASLQEIKTSYEDLVNVTNEPSDLSRAELVQEAYDILSDETSKYIYDNMGYNECVKYVNGNKNTRKIYEKQILQFIKTHELYFNVSVTLYELYTGVEKEVTVQIVNQNNEKVDKKYIIYVPRGYEQNVLITYVNEGNHEPGKKPGDLIFIMQIMPDEKFELIGRDVHTILDISVEEAICCDYIKFMNFNNQSVCIKLQYFDPNKKYMLEKMGMYNESGSGDLYIKFNVIYSPFSEIERENLRNLFKIPHNLSDISAVDLHELDESDEEEQPNCTMQ